MFALQHRLNTRQRNSVLKLKDAGIRERLHQSGGVEPWITTAEEFALAIRQDHAKYARLVRDAGVRID